MKHVIVGTAGHIDHGKTTLIKAITGRETDRLKEEQERGISIELGFTYFDLPSGERAGIIDVPGHEKFVKNMLAGVTGIDIVLLVVAADEGMMPQTLEHLHILDLAGIEKGFVVMTKSDMVDEDWCDLVEEDIKEELVGTFLENAPIMRVSSTKKTGIKEVIDLIEDYTEDIEEKNDEDMVRLPVDRVFSISGFGTIVTGTLISGTLKVGDEVQIYPGNSTARVRTLQVHDEDAEIAYAGQRVATNLAGIKTDEVERGDSLAPIDSMQETMMIDVKFKLLKTIDRSIENRTRVRLYLGTKEVLCRLILLDRDIINPGEEVYAQLRLEEEIVAKREDRFIIRFYSPMFTIGGGKILEINPPKRKRFNEKDIKELELKDIGSQKDILESIIEDKSYELLSIKELSVHTSMLYENVKKEVEELRDEEKIIVISMSNEDYIIHRSYFNEIRGIIKEELLKYHENYPLRTGMSKEEIKSKVFKGLRPKVVDEILELLILENSIGQKNENLHLNDFEIDYNEDQKKKREEILNVFKDDPYRQVRREEISEEFRTLINDGSLIKLTDDYYTDRVGYEKALTSLKDYIQREGAITVADYRDILNTNRKVSMALLEYFDQKKITKRDGDKRTVY